MTIKINPSKNKKRNIFRSGFEERVIQELDNKGVDYGYETHMLEYSLTKQYVPDIIFTKEDGSVVMVECKGYWDKESRKKMKVVREQNPDADIRILFQRASEKISKESKTTYGEYATKVGYVWAEGTEIPEEWYK